MRTAAALLDKAKDCRSIPSDMALAKKIDVSRAALSEWRSGTKRMPDARVRQIAELANEDPGYWLVAMHHEWAEADVAKDWETVLKRLASAAALVIAFGLSAAAEKAVAATSQGFDATSNTLYIMRSRVRRMLRRLARALQAQTRTVPV